MKDDANLFPQFGVHASHLAVGGDTNQRRVKTLVEPRDRVQVGFPLAFRH
jgi:hypothetical protein